MKLLLWRNDKTKNLTIKNTKFNVKKSFQPKVTTTRSTRSEFLHYTNKRVTNILLMYTQQVQKNNKQLLYQQKINRKKHHPNPASVQDLEQDLSDLWIWSPTFKSTTTISGTLSPNLISIQRLVNRETRSGRCWSEKKTATKEQFSFSIFSCWKLSQKPLLCSNVFQRQYQWAI